MKTIIHLVRTQNFPKSYHFLPLVRTLQVSACDFTKSNTPPWVFFEILKLYKWYQIVHSIMYKT